MSPALILAAEVVVSALIVLGGAFALVGSFGLARLPTLMTRLHGPSKATTLGVGGCLAASVIYFPVFGDNYSAHELLIALFLFLSAPITAHMIAKAHIQQMGEGDQAAGGEAGQQDPRPPPSSSGAPWATSPPAEDDKP